MSGFGRFSQRKQNAVAALLAHSTVTAAAAAAGISERSLRRWLSDAAFQAEYTRARRDAMARAVARLQAGAGEAVDILLSQARGGSVAAAKAAVTLALRAVEVEDFDLRLTAIEARLGIHA